MTLNSAKPGLPSSGGLPGPTSSPPERAALTSICRRNLGLFPWIGEDLRSMIAMLAVIPDQDGQPVTLQLINPEDLPPPATYTHVIVAAGSRMVFIAGQEPEDAQGNLVGPGDLASQA